MPRKLPLLIATANEGIRREFREILSPVFQVLAPEAFDNVPPDVIEDGTTYFENALKKAVAYYKIFKTPVLSDDSGLEVDGLGGEPGVYSARYGGDSMTWPERWDFLYYRLKGHPEPWSARFRCVLCYYEGTGVPVFFEGVSEGLLLSNPKGSEGFGYDPIFYSQILGKSFGEASAEEKEKVSHRGLATQTFLIWSENLVAT